MAAMIFFVLSLAVIGTQGVDGSNEVFVFCVPHVRYAYYPNVFISTQSPQLVNTTITIHGTGFEQSHTLTRESHVDISLPASVYMRGTGVAGDKTVTVRADAKVSVHVMVGDFAGGEGFLVFPTHQLGTSHNVLSHVPESDVSYESSSDFVVTESFICISAFTDKADISIITSGGEDYKITLQAYESFQLLDSTDMTGSQVISDVPISVVAGTQLTCFAYSCNPLVEQMPPVRTWGTRAIMSPFTSQDNGFTYKVIGTRDTSTDIIISNSTTRTLSGGEWYEGDVTGSDIVIIDADNPILVMQYMKGQSSQPQGGPSMILAPTTNRYIRGNVTFPVYMVYHVVEYTFEYYIHVIATCTVINGFQLDGTPVRWDSMTSPDGELCSVGGSVTSNAVHTVDHADSNAGFTVAVYGVSVNYGRTYAASYAYLAGIGDTVEMELPDSAYGSLDDLNRVNVSNGNVVEVAETLSQLTDKPLGVPADIVAIGNILENIVDVENGSVQVTELVVESVSNLLGAADTGVTPTAQFTNTTSSILHSLEKQVSLSLKENDDVRVVDSNVVVQGVKLDTDGILTGGIGLAILSDPAKSFKNFTTETIYEDSYVADFRPSSSIYLSSRIVSNLKDKSTDELRFLFVAYRNDFLFPSKRAIRDSLVVDGVILSASVEGVNPKELKTLTEPVTIEHQGQQDGNNSTGIWKTDLPSKDSLHYPEPQCVFWDVGINDWSPHGCRYLGFDNVTDSHQCECDHLTNFAVLLYHGEKPIVSKALDIISKVGCGLSIATLGLTVFLLTFLNNRKRRGVPMATPNSTDGKVKARTLTIHLSVSLIGLYSAFLIGIDWTYSKVNCTVTAAFLHYFVLTSMAWMTVEARFLYIKLVKVFDPESDKFVIKSAFLAWGVPLIVVGISMGVSFGLGSDDYQNKLYCFPKVGYVVYFALLLPIGVELVHNIVSFTLIIKSIFQLQNRGRTERQIFIDRSRRSMTITFLLGLTWIFGFLAIESATLVFQWLFCILNSCQGVFIFTFICLTQDEVKTLLFSILRRAQALFISLFRRAEADSSIEMDDQG